MAAAAGPRARPANSLSPTRSGMTELMPFPHQTAVKPHISQQWLERSRSKLERQGHGPALDNLWSSDTLALYPIVSDEACERMSADRRVLQQIKNKQNIKSRHRGRHRMLLGALRVRAYDRAGLCSATPRHLRSVHVHQSKTKPDGWRPCLEDDHRTTLPTDASPAHDRRV